MPSGVKIKRGDGAPAAGADGSGGVWPYELAWDYTNNKLYINDNGTMREIGGGEVSAVANGSDNRIATFSSSTALNGEANLTFDGSTLALTGDLNVDSNTLFVDSSEDSVGIGTTSPGALLTVYKDGTQASSVSTSYQLQTVSNSNGGIAIQAGASSKAMLVFGDNGDYDAGKIEYHNSTHHMDFTFNGTKRIEFMDDGQIHWGSAAAHGVLSWDTGRAIVGSSGSNNLDLKAPSGYAVVVNEAGSNVDFRVEGDSNANLLFTDAGNDRVGIGTNSPSARFHVSADAESVMWFQNGSTSNVQSIEMDASRFYFYNRTASAFNSIAVLNSGSVGIGAISPSQKLEVAGTIKATGTGGFTIGNVADVARIQESSGTFTVLTTGNAYANLEVDDLTTAGKIIHEGDTDTYMTFQQQIRGKYIVVGIIL